MKTEIIYKENLYAFARILILTAYCVCFCSIKEIEMYTHYSEMFEKIFLNFIVLDPKKL